MWSYLYRFDIINHFLGLNRIAVSIDRSNYSSTTSSTGLTHGTENPSCTSSLGQQASLINQRQWLQLSAPNGDLGSSPTSDGPVARSKLQTPEGRVHRWLKSGKDVPPLPILALSTVILYSFYPPPFGFLFLYCLSRDA